MLGRLYELFRLEITFVILTLIMCFIVVTPDLIKEKFGRKKK